MRSLLLCSGFVGPVDSTLMGGFPGFRLQIPESLHRTLLWNYVSSPGGSVVGAFVMERNDRCEIKGVGVIFIGPLEISYGNSLVETTTSSVIAPGTATSPRSIAWSATPPVVGLGKGRLMLQEDRSGWNRA